ncbi:MAG: hypothetical protein ACD_62C00339G0003 [uncultured bacterium]|nr:MAG: hypothetical protein ACD_62C00339G0003 [uncultured bacterium]HLD43916.1 hydrogenase maturation nickel metallochaperone HypA [bacterium]
MHELSIATSIVEIVENNLKTYPTGKARSVTVQLGTHCGVEPSALEFCFPIAIEGTRVQGAQLILQILPLTLNCSSCLAQNVTASALQCPHCHSPEVTVVSGRDMIVTSIDLDVK